MATKKKNLVVHDDDVKVGDEFVIPRNMTYAKAIDILDRKRVEAESEHAFAHQFKAKPYDGAYALTQVLRDKFGITFGKGQESFFGRRPPQMLDINISATEQVQIPWGTIMVPTLEDALFQTMVGGNEDIGSVFVLNVTAKRKYKKEIEEIFELVETFIKEKSIYRGKALIGHENPEFIDMTDFDPDQIVYSREAQSILETTVWAPIKMTEVFRQENVSRKRAVLLHGPFGTGKTLAGQLTAKIAVENGWTFIAARPGRDNLDDIMRTARLYMPSVVFFEDVDGSTKPGEDNAMSEMLDVFDGITSKGGELIVLMTTNYLEKIHKGMLRPGRLDALVEIGALDRYGMEKLIKAAVKPGKLGTIDYDAVYTSMVGFFPAFIREAVNRASSVAISRNASADYMIDTEDLQIAAMSLRPQLEQMEKAATETVTPEIAEAFENIVSRSMERVKMVYNSNDEYELVSKDN